MSNTDPKLGKPVATRNTVSTSKLAHPAALKVDERSALDFSELLQRRSEYEKGMERDRELLASKQQGRNKAELNSLSMQSDTSVPDLFLQSRSHHSSNIIEESQSQTEVVSEGAATSNPLSANPLTVKASETNSRLVVERLVETVYREWQSQSASRNAQKWTIQLDTGHNTSSELIVEYTSEGEWFVRIADNTKSHGSGENFQDFSETMNGEWDYRQFCLELEACLKERRPDISFRMSPYA